MTRYLILFFLLSTSTLKAEVYVFAAISLQSPLQSLKMLYESQNKEKIILVLAGTPVIARQIEAGAKADIFISAHPSWSQHLKKHLLPNSQKILAYNRLVLVVPSHLPKNSTEEILKKRVAMGDPNSVPAGIYAKQALVSLQLWESTKTVFAHNVRLALAWTARGDTQAGIVYKSDAHIEPRVRVVHTFSPSRHEPIFYTAALLRNHNPDARAFYNFLQSPITRDILTAAGFVPP